MAPEKEVPSGLEWRISVPEGSSVKVELERGLASRVWFALLGVVMAIRAKVLNLGRMLWKMGADDPRKLAHAIKVGLTLGIVSVFYYSRPLYNGVGGSAMWAVMTVVVIFEFSIGGSLYKGINRCIATFTAGALAIGVHWIASKSGETMEPVIRSVAVFLLASAATFSRFIPKIKVLFDYGITIFILTFSLIAVSGYRVEKLVELAQQRVSTIGIGVAICFLISFLVCPVWSGTDLHVLITHNMDKLADSLEACMDEYFNKDASGDKKKGPSQNSQGYKCVLSSKASEDSLANLARWEPAHGHFGFRHPWNQYQKIGAAMRYCAYCIEALHGCINSEIQASETVNKNLSDHCIRLSSMCSKVLKESSTSIKSMQRSGRIDFLVDEMNTTMQELHTSLFIHPHDQSVINFPLAEALPLITVASLLIEIVSRVEGVVNTVDKLATVANFKAANDEKPEKKEVEDSIA